jgi:hypothetical protein
MRQSCFEMSQRTPDERSITQPMFPEGERKKALRAAVGAASAVTGAAPTKPRAVIPPTIRRRKEFLLIVDGLPAPEGQVWRSRSLNRGLVRRVLDRLG